MKTFSDEKLADLFTIDRDVAAYNELYSRYFPILVKFGIWKCSNVDMAKDAAQHVLIKFFENPESFNSSRIFKPWIFTLIANHFKNNWRNEANRHRLNQNLLDVPEDNNEEFDYKHRLEKINQALSQLKDSHKEIFLLKYSSNLSIKEISNTLNISEGTVKSRLFYSIQNIRKNIKEYENG